MKTLNLKRPAVLFGASYLFVSALSVGSSLGTPQFARKTKLACSACHTHIPLLNEFGQKFYANGFRLPANHKTYDTLPLYASLEAQGATTPGSKTVPVTWDQSEIASYGFVDSANFLYHLEWFPTTNQVVAYGIHPFGEHFAAAVGNINAMSQYDPTLDISLSLPAYLTPVPNTPNSTIQGPFSPGGTLMGARVSASLGGAMPYGQGWQAAATAPVSNEVGNAPTFDANQSPHGVFFELFDRQGMNSYGVNSYFGQDGRHYYGTVLQQKLGSFFLEGGGAYADGYGGSTHVYSVGADWVPAFDKALAFRIDSQDNALSFVPTASWELIHDKTALRLVLESSLSRGIQPTTTFMAQLHF